MRLVFSFPAAQQFEAFRRIKRSFVFLPKRVYVVGEVTTILPATGQHHTQIVPPHGDIDILGRAHRIRLGIFDTELS